MLRARRLSSSAASVRCAAAAAAEGRWPWPASAHLLDRLDSVNQSPLFTSYFANWREHLVMHTLSDETQPHLSLAMFHDRRARIPSSGDGRTGGGVDQDAPWQLVAAITVGPRVCGHVGTLHGGLQSTLLDEAMGCLLAVRGLQPALTAFLNCTYRGPAPAPGALLLRARVARQDGRKLFLEGELRAPPPGGAEGDVVGGDGQVIDIGGGALVAEASALFVQPKDSWAGIPGAGAAAAAGTAPAGESADVA